MHPMLNIAIRVARAAGHLIIKYYEKPDAIKISDKGNSNFLTNVDVEAEHLMVKIIRKFYLQHTIIGKENNILAGKDKSIQWIINPISDTINFIKRFPHFAVSIAIQIKGRTEISLIYDPINNELFTAVRGQGAQLNNYRIRSSNIKKLKGTILAIGFLFNYKKYANDYINILSKLFTQCIDFRSTGSTALDLAYVASGRVDGFLKINSSNWEIASGKLLVLESGGIVTDFNRNYAHLSYNYIIAGNPCIVKDILLSICNV